MRQTFSKELRAQVTLTRVYEYLDLKDLQFIWCCILHNNNFSITGSVKIEIKPVNPFGAKTPVDAEEKDDGDSKTDDSRWRESKREPVKPLSDPQIVRDFLMGDHCLYGGTGWWKYEFCYGMFLFF